MALLHFNEPVIMNLKKIRRLMRKYGLVCPIRHPNPYRNLSTVKDAFTKEILSYQISQNLKEQFVLDTFRQLALIHGKTLTKDTLVHSDQGAHYKSRRFDDLMEDSNFIRSMSRKATCWDNAPQESFFGHMKDEIEGKVAECKTFPQVTRAIMEYMNYYNHYRYQWDLAKLSPAEYYEYSTTGIYPLPKTNNKNYKNS